MESAQQPTGPHSDRRAGPVVPRERRLRLVLAVAAGVVALLCLGGAGIVFMLYDDATEINRGSPDVAVDNYLRATLVDRSDSQAALFRCEKPDDLSMVAGLQEEIKRREERFDVRVSITWSSLLVRDAGDGRRSVEVSLTIAGSADGQPRSRRTEVWTFEVADQNGWRVCGGRKVG